MEFSKAKLCSCLSGGVNVANGGCSYNALPDNGRLLHNPKSISSTLSWTSSSAISFICHTWSLTLLTIGQQCYHIPLILFQTTHEDRCAVPAMTNNHYNDNYPIARKGWKWLALQQHCVLQCIAMTNNSITLMTKTMQGWNMNIFHHCWLRTPELSAPGQTRQLVRSHLHLHLQLFLECEQLYCQLLLVKENHVPNFHHLFSCPSLCLAFELWTLLHNRKGNVWNITMAPQCLPTSSGGWWTHYHICFRTITSIIL